MVGISVDEAPESQLLRRTLGLEFALLHDEDADLGAAFGVRMVGESMAIPSVFVVTSGSAIVWRHVGEYVPDRPTPDAVLAVTAAARR